MSEQKPFNQNVIAIIWDFDKTLSPVFMQQPLFEHFGVDEERFWKEVNALPAYYAKINVTVQPDSCYLGHLLTCVREGIMPGLNNRLLRELGARIPLYPGLPECFDRINRLLDHHEYAEADLRVEHYVVSTGLKEMILGTPIASKLSGIWACEFIEVPASFGYNPDSAPEHGVISQIATLLDNTTKTRALFEINKGVNKTPGISVNDAIPETSRRVPFRNMIYIADGPSDIPCFSVVRKNGGMTYAVYDPDSKRHFQQAVSLQESERVHAFGPADYTENSHTDWWLRYQVRRIADRMLEERKSALNKSIQPAPTHGA
ncbi:MAG TPA: HAD family hydrolase [Candidatus Hydrogenedentes bacterium]|nr:HAD family hydrolase [Candidatus Hydrogenedentota bacterium]HPU98361.1 HAD family hydrolase [Candidatus Hydrogenedentota bacterium]